MDLSEFDPAHQHPSCINDSSLDNTLRTCALWGGAVSCSIPRRFDDVSVVRPLPDHQEVYADADHDQSIIFELNQRCAVEDAGVLMHYFRDLSASNEAVEGTVVEMGELTKQDLPLFAFSNDTAGTTDNKDNKDNRDNALTNDSDEKGEGGHGNYMGYMWCEQKVAKYKETDEKANTVIVFLAVIRLKEQATDFLISCNFPTAFAKGSVVEGTRVCMCLCVCVYVGVGVCVCVHLRMWLCVKVHVYVFLVFL